MALEAHGRTDPSGRAQTGDLCRQSTTQSTTHDASIMNHETRLFALHYIFQSSSHYVTQNCYTGCQKILQAITCDKIVTLKSVFETVVIKLLYFTSEKEKFMLNFAVFITFNSRSSKCIYTRVCIENKSCFFTFMSCVYVLNKFVLYVSDKAYYVSGKLFDLVLLKNKKFICDPSR